MIKMIVIVIMKRMDMVAYAGYVDQRNKRFITAYVGVERQFMEKIRLPAKDI